MKWFLKCLRQYADFKGRARRKEYWMFLLFDAIFAIVAGGIDYVAGTSSHGVFYGLFILGTFIPSTAVAVRRLHDIGKSGWMYLVVLIPLIGAIWLLILFVRDSQEGENQYGPNPKTGNLD